MSTRYVWGKYNYSNELYPTTAPSPIAVGEQYITVSANYKINSNGTFSPQGSTLILTENTDGQYTNYYPYAFIGNSTSFDKMYTTDAKPYVALWANYNGIFGTIGGGDYNVFENTIVPTKGDLQGYASSSTDGAYPADGVSGNVWYTKQGIDNIDPSACSIPSTIMGGTQITITVTPGTGKVYAGTVSYIYQVKLGSGSWQTIATTTATTRTYTVPYGTESIQARVRAQDNLGFTSTDYVTSSSVTVINNQPPTAPGSIEVTNVIKGQTATITITAATDPDGTVESYIYERSIDGSAFTQIANVNALSQTDQVSADWGTVAYRVCAVDDDGDSGPYVTSETTTVNSGWIIISGPAADMGDKPAPFNFVFTPNVTGQTGVTDISVVVTLDGEEIYNDTPDAGQEVSIPIDTRLMRAGEHTIQVAASKEDFLEASGSYEFNIPAITLPDGGIAEMLQNPEGDVVFPYTLARLVIGKDGKDVNALLEEILGSAAKFQVLTYTGTGTHGQSNPNSVTFDFEPKVVFISRISPVTTSNGKVSAYYVWGAPCYSVMYSYNNTQSVGIGNSTASAIDKTMTWYNTALDDGTAQMNASGASYKCVAIG